MGKSTISMVIFNSKLLNYQRVENIRNREKSLTDIENHQQSPSNYGIENAGKWWNMQISHVGFPQHVQLPPPWLFIRFFKGGSIEPNSTLPQVQVMLHHVTFFSLFHSSNVSHTNLTATNDALVDSGCPAALFFSAGVQSVQWVIQHISSFNIPRTDDSVRHIGIILSFKDPKNHDQFSHLIWVRFPGISWGLSQKPRVLYLIE